MSQEIKKIDVLTEEIEQKYDLSKGEAVARLRKAGVTDSESDQMLLLWCRKGLIDSIRITKGPVTERGVRVSSVSLEAFIVAKQGTVENVLERLYQEQKRNEILQRELNRVNLELKKFREDGYVLKKKRVRKVKVDEVEVLSADKKAFEIRFRYNRSQHVAKFDDDQMLVELKKRTRTDWINVTDISDNLRTTLEDLCVQYTK